MSETSLDVRLQNLRDFTVQIRHTSSDSIVGTGIVVSMDGKIVTCAHVVSAAGVELENADGLEVGIYFPQVRGNESKAHRAVVAGCFPQYDDDVAVLQLLGPSPLAPEQVAVLGRAELSESHEFRSYGYRRLEEYNAGYATGTILGEVEPPEGRRVQADPVQLESSQINRGMSGAAVLDKERNLIVGIISETWFPDSSTKDRDTAWAVNARVLSFEPLHLPLQEEPLPKREAPQPKTDIPAAQAATVSDPGILLNGAPAPFSEWVGRDDLLKSLNGEWIDSNHLVLGLIGFGGEGKSSLARYWLDTLLVSQSRPDGVFWWSFYDKPNENEFFAAALDYLSGKRISPDRLPLDRVKAQVIGAMLGAGRYLFILDGLEVIQRQSGDQYGLLTNEDMREFLRLFATPGHQSFCLITSRAPVLDLVEYTTYIHYEVDRLSPSDGRNLLRKLGIKGADSLLDKVVADWDGHALTLSLLSAYLVDKYNGDVGLISDIPGPGMNEPRYERVHRVLRRYDEYLTEAERTFLIVLSTFRLPVKENAFRSVFCQTDDSQAINAPLAKLKRKAFTAVLTHLSDYRLVHHNAQTSDYRMHPIVRAYYGTYMDKYEPFQIQALHERIAEYYLSVADETLTITTLNDLTPLIEAMYHTCQAGQCDDAYDIFVERIQSEEDRLFYRFGAWETALTLLRDLFPNGDFAQEPLVYGEHEKISVLSKVGLCLMDLGHLREALPLYMRVTDRAYDIGDFRNVCREDTNLAELYYHLGLLDEAVDAIDAALSAGIHFLEVLEGIIAREFLDDMGTALAYKARVLHALGRVGEAGTTFLRAQAYLQEFEPDLRYLYSDRGIFHADHLRQVGDPVYARSVTEANLRISEQEHWPGTISQCHRVLGDLAEDRDDHENAHKHYEEAVKEARNASRQDILIRALLARGLWVARRGEGERGKRDLDEAMNFALAGEYRLYEAELRVAFAWVYLATNNISAARAEAMQAQAMSAEMKYYWGTVQARDVLSRLNEHAKTRLTLERKQQRKKGTPKRLKRAKEPSRGSTTFVYRGHTDTVYSVAWSPDGDRIASASRDKTVQIWNALTGDTLLGDKDYSGDVYAVVWSPDGRQFASAGEEGSVRVYNSATENVFRHYNHSSAIYALAWSPDGKYLASAGKDGTVQVWDVTTEDRLLSFEGHIDAVKAVAWSPDGKRLVSGSGDTTVQIWDVSTRTSFLTYEGHSQEVRAVAWSPDGKRIFSGSTDCTVQVWDVATGSTLMTYAGHDDRVNALALSPDGLLVASASDACTVQVWNAETGESLFSHWGYSRSQEVFDTVGIIIDFGAWPIRAVTWSPNGRFIASGEDDWTVQIWKAN